MPAKTEKQILFLYGRKSVVILDEFYNLYVSRDGGKTFKENSKFKLKDAITGSYGIVYSDFAKFYRGKKGFYIIDKEDEARILFHEYKDTGKFVAFPKLDEEIRGRIYETAQGVVLFDVGYANATEVFHMLNGSKKWTKSIIPKNLCRNIKLTDYKKGKFHVECAPGHLSGGAEDYESYDSGATWKKLK